MDEVREDEGMELADEQLESVTGGNLCVIELPEDRNDSNSNGSKGGN